MSVAAALPLTAVHARPRSPWPRAPSPAAAGRRRPQPAADGEAVRKDRGDVRQAAAGGCVGEGGRALAEGRLGSLPKCLRPAPAAWCLPTSLPGPTPLLHLPPPRSPSSPPAPPFPPLPSPLRRPSPRPRRQRLRPSGRPPCRWPPASRWWPWPCSMLSTPRTSTRCLFTLYFHHSFWRSLLALACQGLAFRQACGAGARARPLGGGAAGRRRAPHARVVCALGPTLRPPPPRRCAAGWASRAAPTPLAWIALTCWLRGSSSATRCGSPSPARRSDAQGLAAARRAWSGPEAWPGPGPAAALQAPRCTHPGLELDITLALQYPPCPPAHLCCPSLFSTTPTLFFATLRNHALRNSTLFLSLQPLLHETALQLCSGPMS